VAAAQSLLPSRRVSSRERFGDPSLVSDDVALTIQIVAKLKLRAGASGRVVGRRSDRELGAPVLSNAIVNEPQAAISPDPEACRRVDAEGVASKRGRGQLRVPPQAG
jgi:hypothetical protein